MQSVQSDVGGNGADMKKTCTLSGLVNQKRETGNAEETDLQGKEPDRRAPDFCLPTSLLTIPVQNRLRLTQLKRCAAQEKKRKVCS